MSSVIFKSEQNECLGDCPLTISGKEDVDSACAIDVLSHVLDEGDIRHRGGSQDVY